MPFIDRTGWLVTADSESGGLASNVIDGNIATYWQPANFGQPHTLDFDMLAAYDIGAIEILGLAGGNTNNIGNISLFVSADGVSWGSAVETKSFLNTTDLPDYWILSTIYNTRYFRLSIHSLNGVFIQIAEVYAGTLTALTKTRPTSTSVTTGTCGDNTLNPGLAIDSDTTPPATFATVQQLDCGAFSTSSVLKVLNFPATPLDANSVVKLVIWSALELDTTDTHIVVNYNGVPISDTIAGGDISGPYTLQKNEWILPEVTNLTLLDIDFSHHVSAGGVRLANNLLIYDVYIETLTKETPPPTQGNIVITKAANGPDQSFTFVPSWDVPFELLNGESQDSGPLDAGTYSFVETPVDNWITTYSQDPAAILLNAGQTINILVTNNFVSPETQLSLVGDFSEGIGHDHIKWDKWTYFNNCRLLGSLDGKSTNLVNILDSGKITKEDITLFHDFIDESTSTPIDHFAITAGFTDAEDMINFLYAIVMRVIGQGSFYVSAMQMDDEFNINPVNRVDCPSVILLNAPGKVLQFTPRFQGEKYYLMFECQPSINNDDSDIDAYFIISRFTLFSTPVYTERPQ